MTLRIRVRIEGADDLLTALGRLGRGANADMRREAFDIADYLADKLKIAGRNDSRQSARAARSIKAVRDRWPIVQAGGTARADAVLYGSEFGATRRFGWYARARYGDSVARQFRPHRGSRSYWFFTTAEREQPWVEREWVNAAQRIIDERFGLGRG